MLDDTAIQLLSIAEPPQSPLEPQASYTSDESVSIPGSLAPGSYYLIFAADADGAQAVTDPAGLIVAVPITLSAANLIVTSATAPSWPPWAIRSRYRGL